jgi:hypothetical protein
MAGGARDKNQATSDYQVCGYNAPVSGGGGLTRTVNEYPH